MSISGIDSQLLVNFRILSRAMTTDVNFPHLSSVGGSLPPKMAAVLARAGLQPAHGMQGQSLLPVVSGQADGLRTSVLIEEEGQRLDFNLGQRIRMRTLRTSDHRLTIYDGQPWGELCNLRADPHELRNLWNDPASQALRSQLMAELAYAMLQQTNTSPYPLASA